MRRFKHMLLLAGAIAAVIGSVLSATYTYKMFETMDRIRRNSHSDIYRLQMQIQQLEEEFHATVADRLFELIRPVGGSCSTEREDLADTETETVPEPETESEPELNSETEAEAETTHESESAPDETLPTFQESAPDESETENRGDTETAPSSESESVTEVELETETELETEVETESVTLPTHESQETEPTESETTAPEPAPSEPSDTPTELYIITTHNGRIGVFDATGTLVRTVNVFVFTLPDTDRQALEVGIAAYSRAEADRIASKYE